MGAILLEKKMVKSQTKRKRNLVKTAVMAAASVGLYTALFANEGRVITYFTKGGAYAALPVLTAFAFSIIHGSFASQCLEMLGLTASSSVRKTAEADKQKQAVTRKDGRPRLEVK